MDAIIIGLVSDTHGLFRSSIPDALAGVSLILHAGDVGGDSILHALAAIAPRQPLSRWPCGSRNHNPKNSFLYFSCVIRAGSQRDRGSRLSMIRK